MLDDSLLEMLGDTSTSLKVFRAARCHQLTWYGLANLASSIGPRGLKSLEVGGGPYLQDQGILHLRRIVHKCPHLLELKLCWGRDNILVTDVIDLNFCVMTPDLQNLVRLHLVGCCVGDVTMEAVAQHCRHLRFLSLRDSSLTDSGLIHLATGLHAIQWLDLSHCTHVTNAGVECVATTMRLLVSLKLSGCFQISNSAVQACLRNLTKLRDLYLDYCFHVSSTGFYNATLLCPSLRYVDVSSTLVCRYTLDELRQEGNPALVVVAENCPCVIDPTLISACRVPVKQLMNIFRSQARNENAHLRFREINGP